MKRRSSLRFIDWPIEWRSVTPSVVALISPLLCANWLGGRCRLGAQDAGGLLDRRDDVLVAGAAAEVAGDRLADLGLARIGVALQEHVRGHQHPRRAKTALQAVTVPERLLQRMELAALREPLDGRDRVAVGLDREHRARLDRALAVEHDRADAAARRVAADVRAGQAERFAQEVGQQRARFDVALVRGAVDGDGDFHRNPPTPSRSSAMVSARETNTPAIAFL